MTTPQIQSRQLTLEITRGFTNATFDLSLRPGADRPGWEGIPETIFAAALAASRETPSYIRASLTLVAAMDRARDATELWRRAARLHAAHRWVFLPDCVKEKLPHAAAAKDLYMSPLFIGRRRYVEGRASRWFILSAKHGLVDPSRCSSPMTGRCRLSQLRRDERGAG